MTPNIDYETEIIELANHIQGLPNKGDIIEHATYNEWGVALDLLCYQIEDMEIKISKDTFDKIIQLAKSMEMEDEVWKPLEPLVE